MFRSLIILFVWICGMAVSEVVLLDGFFNNPINESTNVFRNPSLYPYRYHNVDDEFDRSKRSLSETKYWDAPKPLLNNWFSSRGCDYSLLAKSMIIALACIAGLGLILIFVFIYKKYFIKASDYNDCDGYDNETENLCP